MKRRPIMSLVAVALLVLSCKGSEIKEYIPAEPDYSQPSEWYVNSRGAQADIFYIVSTETIDYYTPDGSICHYADTYVDSLRTPMLPEIEGVEALLAEGFNYYSPFYRQCSLESFTEEALWNQRLKLPFEDVRKAFAWYLENENGGRPFILAGFSQGAMHVLSLLGQLDDETYNRLIAAYVIGATVPEEDGHVVAAKGADDTGVTICYNSVREVEADMWPSRSAFAINPLNWRTDSEPGTVVTVPSPKLPLDEQEEDSLKVTLDPVSNLLIVEGFTGTGYQVPLIGKDGNYHSREIWFYRESLKENMALRCKAMLEKLSNQ